MKSKRLLVALQATLLTLSASVSAEPLTDAQIPTLDPTTTSALPATDFAQLTAAQVALFTSDVVATLTAEQVAAIPAVAFAGFTAEQLAVVTVEAAAGLIPEQVAELSVEQLDALTDEVAESLTAEQTAQLTDEQKASLAPPVVAPAPLTDDEIKALDAAGVTALTAEQLALVTAEQMALLTVENAAGLTAEQLAGLTVAQLDGLTDEVAQSLTDAQKAGLTDEQKTSLTPPVVAPAPLTDDEIKALDAAGVTALTAEQLALVTAEQMALLTVENAAGLTAEQLAGLTVEQLAGLTGEVAQSLTDEQKAKLTQEQVDNLKLVQTMTGLTDDEIKALDAAGVTALTAEQLALITPEQMALLTVENSAGFTAEQLKSLTPEQVEGLTDEVVKSLGDKLPPPPAPEKPDLATLDAAAIAKLPIEVVATLTVEDVAKITVEAIVGLTAEQLKALSIEAVVGLSADQLEAIKALALENLSPEQMDALSNEQKLPLFTENGKVSLCHVTGTDSGDDDNDDDGDDGDDDDGDDDDNKNGSHTIEVDEAAVPTHLGQGDSVGPCAEVETSGIDTASLTVETIAKLTIEEVASLTADDISKIPAEAIKGLTKEQIVAITIEAIVGFTLKQLPEVTPEAEAGFTAEQSAKLSEDQIAALTDNVAVDENAELEDIEKIVADLDEEANPLHALIKIRLFLSIDINKLEVKFEGKHGKKRFSKEFAEAIKEFYEKILPKGWKVKVKEKHGQFFIKIKVKHHHHFKFGLIKFVKVGFVPAIDFEADVEDGETDDDVAEQVAELPADAAGALTEEQLAEEIPEKAIETLKATNEGASIKIFLAINLSSPEMVLKFLPPTWEVNAETGKVAVPTEAAKQLPTEVLTPASITTLEPEVASNFSAEQVTKLKPETVAAMPTEMFLQIQLSSLKGLQAPQLGAISFKVLFVFTPEMMAAIDPAAIVAGFKAEQLHEIGRSKMTELFTDGQISSIIGSAPVLDDPTLDTPTTDTEEPTDDTGTEEPTDDDTGTEEPTDDDDGTEEPTDEPVDIVDDSGKIEMPKITPEFSGKISFPAVVNLSISFTFNGKAFEGGVLGLLSQTLQSLGFGDFSTFKQENGVMLVEGSGESEGVGFAFMPPTDDAIQPTAEGAEAGLTEDENGNIVVNTDEGLAVTVESAPKDPEALAEVVDGEVAVAEDGTTTISGDIQTADAGAEAPTEIVGEFDPMVVPAPEGAEPGVTVEGEPGVNETATVVYPDGTMQTLSPAVEDKVSLDAAVEEIAPEVTLMYHHGVIHFMIDGYQMFAIPEFKITKVSKKPAKAVINVLVPGKVVEFISTAGKRQVLYIGIVGETTTATDEEASSNDDSTTEAPVDAGDVPATDAPVTDEGTSTEPAEGEVTDPAIAEGEPAPTTTDEEPAPAPVPPIDESTATPGDGEVPTTETEAVTPAEEPVVTDEAA